MVHPESTAIPPVQTGLAPRVERGYPIDRTLTQVLEERRRQSQKQQVEAPVPTLYPSVQVLAGDGITGGLISSGKQMGLTEKENGADLSHSHALPKGSEQ